MSESNWFKATRSSGDPNGPGEFSVEDSDGVTWQVKVEMNKTQNRLVCCHPVCQSNDYECGMMLTGDIWDEVRSVLDGEAG